MSHTTAQKHPKMSRPAWVWGIALGASLGVSAIASWIVRRRWRRRMRFVDGFPGLIGNTPLAKAEFLNPGGSSKDRVARQVVEDHESGGSLRSGGTLVEGTSGSTGISLALMSLARGYSCRIVMPDDQAREKSELLRRFGAELRFVRPASIVHEDHYCNVAAREAKRLPGAVFADQFECESNFRAHYQHTGPEVWSQTAGRVDVFVMSAGTGGTIAGVSQYLKERKPTVRVVLADPQGSSLYNKVKHGVAFAREQQEQRIRRHRQDTVVEGVGVDRVTANFARALVDDAVRVTDQEAVAMSRVVLREEGLFLGSSSAVNLVAAVKEALRLQRKRMTAESQAPEQAPAVFPPGAVDPHDPSLPVVVTVLCDSGMRHLTKFWDDQVLAEQWGVRAPATYAEALEMLGMRTGPH